MQFDFITNVNNNYGFLGKHVPSLDILIKYFEIGLSDSEFRSEIARINVRPIKGGQFHDKYIKYDKKIQMLKTPSL